ncbi:MAG: hypothetical protein KGL43_01340, partial [Burkholderiales bacterium]|nr:hypothetical protein [Burkholderiales bacterium]
MQKKRHLACSMFVLAALTAARGSLALGWNPAPQSAVLGQALDFKASLRLDPGDSIAPGCVASEVALGDRRLTPAEFRTEAIVGPRALRVRVATTLPVNEPVVTVSLAIGCPPHLSRRFVLFADPPSATRVAALPPLVDQAGFAGARTGPGPLEPSASRDLGSGRAAQGTGAPAAARYAYAPVEPRPATAPARTAATARSRAQGPLRHRPPRTRTAAPRAHAPVRAQP